MNHLNRFAVALLLLLSTNNIYAQPVFNFVELQSLYPDKDVIILNQKEHLIIKNTSAGLKIQTNKSSEILYLSEKASHLLERSIFYYDNFTLVRDIDANSWIPDAEGKKLRKISVGNIYTRKPVNDNVFYDDIKEKYFTYPSLKKGAVSTLSYSEDIFDPHFLSAFYFGTYAPIENAEFRITLPDDVHLRYVIKDPSGMISFREERSRNTVTYIFSGGRNKGFIMEDDAPDRSHFLPHVLVYIDSYSVGGTKKSVLPDVDALYGWYRELMSRMKNENRAELKEISDSLTKNTPDTIQKIKNVFYWVQQEIKYIAFEEGLGGFIPREPIDTYNKRFGDCKDKAMLINALLNQAGIPAYPVWIGTRDIPYRYAEVPTPQVDNHMISAVKMNGEWVFLDGTAVHLEYGLPTSMIQGKEGLIGLSEKEYKVVEVPAVDRLKSVSHEIYNISLNGERVTGNASNSFTGYFKQNLYYNLSQSGLDKRMQFINKQLALGNSKYEATNITFFPGYENRDSLLGYTFDFVLDDYVTSVDEKMYVNLHIKKPNDYDKIAIDKRFSEVIVDFKNTEIMETTFSIPAGYEIVSIPGVNKFHDKSFGYSVIYEKKDNLVTMRREIFTDALAIEKKDFVEWNKFVSGLNDASKELVIIKKSKP